jgi:hypothetical protein
VTFPIVTVVPNLPEQGEKNRGKSRGVAARFLPTAKV